MEITELLQITKQHGASDLHLTVGVPPAVRLHGDITRLEMPPLEKQQLHDMIYSILTENQRAQFEKTHDLDFAIELQGVARFRVNAYLTKRGMAAVMRIIPARIPSIAELNLPPQMQNLINFERGIVLVTGPTGSGKSTTLAAVLDLMNQQYRHHIITLEDPIEYVHQHNNCIVNQREIGVHTDSFSAALRSALREDPDVILVGEMRDLETIQLALRAAETGHLVFSTLHTNSAAKTVSRIIDVFPPEQQEQIRMQFADAVQAIVAQTLVPTIDGAGRAAGLEILFGNSGVRSLIRENKLHQIPTAMQVASQEGMQTMDQALARLVLEGKVSQEAAAYKANNRENFDQLVMSGVRG